MADENGNSEARIGWGSEFFLANAAGVLTELDEVTEVALPEEMADDVEVTHMKSPGKRKEYKPGLIEPGDGQVSLNYIPGSPTDVLIRAAQNDGKVREFKTTLPDETGEPAWAVSGFLYVKSRSRAVPIGDRLTCTVNVRFTGQSTEEAVA
jgi:hypothetical protein